MKLISFVFTMLITSLACAEGYQEPLYRAWLVGASFSHGPTMHESGPRLSQHLSALMGNNGLTARGDAGYSAAEIYQAGKSLLDKYGHDPADFLIIDLTGSVFYERDKLITNIKNLILLYRNHPKARTKTTILVNEYPPLAGGNWFTEKNLPQKEYNRFNQQFNYMVKSTGAQLVPAWEHWRTSDYPHPQLGFKPDYHPTGNSARRAAITLLQHMETIWACKIQADGTSISKSPNC